MNYGETMDEEELLEALATLSGIPSESDSCKTREPGDVTVEKLLPKYISIEDFFHLLKLKN